MLSVWQHKPRAQLKASAPSLRTGFFVLAGGGVKALRAYVSVKNLGGIGGDEGIPVLGGRTSGGAVSSFFRVEGQAKDFESFRAPNEKEHRRNLKCASGMRRIWGWCAAAVATRFR